MQIGPNNYLLRNFREILDGGLPVLVYKIRKLITLPYALVMFALAILLVLLMRLLSPVITVRFASLDIGRIGGLYHADLYLSEKKCGRYQSKYFDIFYFSKSTTHVNNQWKKMWKREINIFVFSMLAQFAERLNKTLPGYEKYQIPNSDFMPSIEELNKYLSGEDGSILFEGLLKS